MPGLESDGGVPIKRLAGAAIDARRVRIEQDRPRAVIRRTLQIRQRPHPERLEKRHPGILIGKHVLRRLVAVELHDIEQAFPDEPQRQRGGFIHKHADPQDPPGEFAQPPGVLRREKAFRAAARS